MALPAGSCRPWRSLCIQVVCGAFFHGCSPGRPGQWLPGPAQQAYRRASCLSPDSMNTSPVFVPLKLCQPPCRPRTGHPGRELVGGGFLPVPSCCSPASMGATMQLVGFTCHSVTRTRSFSNLAAARASAQWLRFSAESLRTPHCRPERAGPSTGRSRHGTWAEVPSPGQTLGAIAAGNPGCTPMGMGGRKVLQ